MAELQNEGTSSVSGGVREIHVSQDLGYVVDQDLIHQSDLDLDLDPSTLSGGSQRSEVNRDQSNIQMSATDISNNFQKDDCSSNLMHMEINSIQEMSQCVGNMNLGLGLNQDSDHNRDQSLARPTDQENDGEKTSKKHLSQEDSNGSNSELPKSFNESSKTQGNVDLSQLTVNTPKQEKKRRGIRFPKDTFISSYFEPPDPWKNASPWTTDDLIAAYKKSCEIHGSKPIVKILQQLHTVSSAGKREASFILKGEKLDHKQVECIEEVLRRVQFHLLDLEGSHLDDECAVALFDMIEYYESACQLNISSNRNIGARGWQACSRLVRRTPTLTCLDMHNCELNERTIPIFGRALRMGCHLTILHMENMALSGHTLVILVAALKMNETLQELFLAENKLMPSDGVQLGNLMRYNHKLNLLDLRKNVLSDVGVSHLCEGLVEQNLDHGLRTLVLWNNQITYQSMPSLGRVLAVSKNLETLNIGHNNVTNEGIHLLKNGLLKTLSLLRIGLQGTGISDEGAVALAEFIADSTILLRIDLRDNEIKTGGLMALSHAMRVNSSVTRIDIDKDTKKESVIKDYAEQQSRLLRDILTFQQRNIQAAAEREDQERERLEKLAIEAAEAREKGPEVSNTESFTVLSDNKVPDDSQQADVNSSEEVTNDGENKEGTPVPDFDSQSSLVIGSNEDHPPIGHQRPNVLFTNKGLQPQESLDSPQPAPSSQHSLHKDVQSEENTEKRIPPQPNLPLVMPESTQLTANTPAEMLLSPQYYPKQLVRKIFSVTHVSEDTLPSPALPSSDLDDGDFDPLNVTKILCGGNPLISESAHPPSMPSSSKLIPPSSVSGDHSPQTSILSPTSLVRDMAEETVKQIVTMDGPDLSEDSACSNYQECLSMETKEAMHDSSLHLNKESLALAPEERLDKETESISEEISEGNSETHRDSPSFLKDTSTPLQDYSQVGISSGNGSSSTGEKELPSNVSSLEVDMTKPLNEVLCTTNGYSQRENLNFDLEEFMTFPNETSLSMKAPDHVSKIESSCDISLRNTNVLNSNVHSSEETNQDKAGTGAVGQLSLSDECTIMTEKNNGHKTNSEKDCDTGVIVTDEIESVLDIENVDLSLEEEPWTAVEGDDSKGEYGKQPDFFTNLSMNGLTQELASALTSLDGAPLEENTDLKPPDEFERELDALLADI